MYFWIIQKKKLTDVSSNDHRLITDGSNEGFDYWHNIDGHVAKGRPG